MIICGFNSYANKDSGAAIVKDSESGDALQYVAISEERLSRVKYAYFSPIRSIHYCMRSLGISSLDEIDLFVTDWCARETLVNTNPTYRKLENDYIMQRISIPSDKLRFTPTHHYAHAASAFYPSNYKDAAILVIDGMGSQAETISLYRGDANGIELLEQCKSQSLGLLYTAVTRKLLGFGTGQEGKTMGLAPYGKNVKKDVLRLNGQYENLQVDYSEFMDRYPERRLLQADLVPCKDQNHITDDYYARIAYEVQDEIERACLHLARYAKEKVNSNNLCLAGGVALNCVANWKIVEASLFENVFIQPAASDAGLPFGMAIGEYYRASNRKTRISFANAYTGVQYSSKEITEELDELAVPYRKTNNEEVAGLIAEGNIVGWFIGGSEYGPRALGHRSILADPRRPEMKDILNAKVKHREVFRPFAPAVLEERASEYFNLDRSSPYMLLAPMSHANARDEIPSVIHYDGTARVQTVNRDNCSKFYDLIKCFEKQTGTPVILNTSFNDNGEPIVETPVDALLCFMRTHMDYLVLEDEILVDKAFITKNDRSTWINKISSHRDKKLKKEYRESLEKLCQGYNALEMQRYLQQEKEKANYHLNYKAYDLLENKIVDLARRGVRTSVLCDRDHHQMLKQMKSFDNMVVENMLIIDDNYESLCSANLKSLIPTDAILIAVYNMAFQAESALASIWDGEIYVMYDRYSRNVTRTCQLLDPNLEEIAVDSLNDRSAEYNGRCNWDDYFDDLQVCGKPRNWDQSI